MLKDDVELMLGRIMEGPLTPALFLLLKSTPDMGRLCKDLGIDWSVSDDSTCRSVGASANHGRRIDLQEWLSNNAQPISL
jgi:hypothetical protein